MQAEQLLTAFDLPAGSRVDRRIPKAMLTEQGGVTAADRRLLRDGVGEFRWVAALKPATVAIASHRDTEREYLEVHILSIGLRSTKRAARLIELVHRAVPYPVVMVVDTPAIGISFAHKRWSQGEVGAVVLDGAPLTMVWNPGTDAAFEAQFLEALALTRQPRHSLLSLYQGWIETVEALEAARRTGRFIVAPSVGQAAARRQALAEYSRLEVELASLRQAAARATQVADRVRLNLDIREQESALIAARSAL